jgi:hypothetical protein
MGTGWISSLQYKIESRYVARQKADLLVREAEAVTRFRCAWEGGVGRLTDERHGAATDGQGGLAPLGGARGSAVVPGGDDRGDVAMVGAAAAAEQLDRGQFVAQGRVVAGEQCGVAVVELLGLIKFGVAERRRIHAQAADAFDRARVVDLGSDVGEVRAVDNEELGRPAGCLINLVDGSATLSPVGRRPSVSTVNPATTGTPKVAAARTTPTRCIA